MSIHVSGCCPLLLYVRWCVLSFRDDDLGFLIYLKSFAFPELLVFIHVYCACFTNHNAALCSLTMLNVHCGCLIETMFRNHYCTFGRSMRSFFISETLSCFVAFRFALRYCDSFTMMHHFSCWMITSNEISQHFTALDKLPFIVHFYQNEWFAMLPRIAHVPWLCLHFSEITILCTLFMFSDVAQHSLTLLGFAWCSSTSLAVDCSVYGY